MIRDRKELEAFERNLMRSNRTTIDQNFKIADALYEEAVRVGALPRRHPLDDLDAVIHLAKVLNSI